MLMRHCQDEWANSDPGGSTAISVVVPRPFFHGMTR
jgi:hypothetical protein